MKQVDMLVDWHTKFEVPVLSEPKIPSIERIDLRNDILIEEVKELDKAFRDGDLVQVADALGDVLYVLLGTACECGLHIHMEKIFDEVHRSNMSKLDENGKVIKRDDGKVLKSNLFTKPNLSFVLAK